MRLRGGHARLGLRDLAGQGQARGFRHLMLPVEEIRRMMGAEIRLGMAAQRLRLIGGAWDDLERQSVQGRRERPRPGRRRAIRGVLFQENEVRHRFQRHQQISG